MGLARLRVSGTKLNFNRISKLYLFNSLFAFFCRSSVYLDLCIHLDLVGIDREVSLKENRVYPHSQFHLTHITKNLWLLLTVLPVTIF
jgi:hypothetical protein